MGLYDDLKCSAPLPGTPPAFVVPGHRFQTKDLECVMAEYEITADGRLVRNRRREPGAEIPAPEPVADYHGDLTFYGGNSAGGWGEITYTADGEDAEWVVYRACFDDGRLVGIAEVEHTRKPALPVARRQQRRKPTDEEVAAWEARRSESLVGRTMFVLWGGREPDDGYAVEVIAEGPGEWACRLADGTLELIDRWSRDRTFFDSKEDAAADRAGRLREWQDAKAEYDAVLESRRASVS